MLRDPESSPEVQQATADYRTISAEALGLTPDQLPNGPEAALDIGRLAAKGAQAIVETRRLLEVNELALNTFFGSFLPALVDARAAAHDIALTQGQFTPLDEASLANAGSGLRQLHEYLAPFELQRDASLPSDVPPISIGTILRLKGLGRNGRDCYLSNMADKYSIVEYGTESPSFAQDFKVPVLVDPNTYTMEEFAAIPAESADGYAGQVVDTWRSIQETERDHPSYTGRPLVVRAAAVLPVPPSEGLDSERFAVDFLPQIGMTRDDINAGVKRAYDTRLLVKGSENVGANYLKYSWPNQQQPVFADSGGKRAPLTVRQGEVVDEEFPTSLDDIGRTPRSQGALALYIAPHIVKEQPRIALPQYSSDGPTRQTKGLGSANVGVGPASSWISSDKRPEGYFDRVAPELLGRPIIVSLQLLTFER